MSSPHVLSNKLAKSMAEDTTHDHTSASIPNIITSETPIILYQVIMQPGSKASIPITFTASIDGLFQLLGLVTYASAEDENDVAASRLAHIIHIQPSQPGRFGAAGEGGLREVPRGSGGGTTSSHITEADFAQVTNSSAQTFSLDNIHPISPCWTSQRPSQT